MAFPGQNYAPPNVYTKTLFENPQAGGIDGIKIPVFIGEGNEVLFQQDLEIVRGSSSSVDQRVPDEDETGRALDMAPSESAFAASKAYVWLQSHAADYSFRESYRDSLSECMLIEPWHWFYAPEDGQ